MDPSLYLSSLILGFGTGAVIAGIAIGLVVAYRGSGVINFGHGAIAAYVAYVYSSLVQDGQYPIPPLPNPLAPLEGIFGIELPGIPAFVSLGDGIPAWAAFAVALVTAAAIGMLVHLAVFRPLRYAPDLAKVVASIGIMLFLQAAIVLRFGSRPRSVEALLPNEAVSWFGVTIQVDRYLVMFLALAAAAALYLLYRYTSFGLATRAASEDEQAATLVGINADRYAALNWVLSTMLAGLFGILVSPIIGLTPTRITLFVVASLGAALLGGMMSFGIAAFAGIAIGSVQSLLFVMESQLDWVPNLNLNAWLPFLVIAVAMVARGTAIPSRGAITSARLPDPYSPRMTRRRVSVYTVFVALVAIFCVVAPFQFRAGLNNTLVGVVFALSLVVVSGYGGQISLMQAAIAGLAAFGLSSLAQDLGIPFPLNMILAVAAATGIGLLLALPSLRTRGASLAIITLASGLAITEIFFNQAGFFGVKGGSRVAQPPVLFGAHTAPGGSFPIGDGKIPSPGFGLLLLAFVVVCAVGVLRLRRSRLGGQFLAVRSNERAAAAAGVNVAAIKMTAFGIGAALAGVAGVLTAWKLGQFRADSFGVFASLSILAFAYLGGISTVGGAVLAGMVFAEGLGITILEELLGFDLGPYTTYFAGFLLIVTAVLNNEGIEGFNRALFSRLADRFRRGGQSDSDPPTGASRGLHVGGDGL